ncbi:MAG: AAA family ATPase [Bacteroidales bacterium]|nr:AAA family ATPase [Bacteroidales bacterium]
MEQEIKYPVGVQTFSQLRQNGYLYLDKTQYIYQLVKRGQYYFLSRPRRFGKSLLLSTIEEYFLGHKELFKGLAIYDLEKNWTPHPVLHFDMNLGQYDRPDGVYDRLDAQLRKYEDIYGKIPIADTSIGNRIEYVLRAASQQTGVGAVLLIDEYDKPLLEAIGNEALQDHYRAQLKPFYGAIKTCDRYLSFAFLTGVTKIGKLSIFSDANSADDISMVDDYAQICGITRHEIETELAQSVKALAQAMGISEEETHKRLKNAYDGYRFTRADAKVYNPFSLLSCFRNKRIDDYWFETGTPTYLMRLLRMHHFNLWDLEGVERQAKKINSISSFASDPIPVIYQSGYITIKGYKEMFDKFRLGFPNSEVKQGFIKLIESQNC